MRLLRSGFCCIRWAPRGWNNLPRTELTQPSECCRGSLRSRRQLEEQQRNGGSPRRLPKISLSRDSLCSTSEVHSEVQLQPQARAASALRF